MLNLIKNIVGPTAVIAAGTMGAGAIATLLLAGAWFGYALLWVILFILPLFVVSVNSASRIGAVNKSEGMLSIIRRCIHPALAWFLLCMTVPVHILVTMGQFSVMSSSFLSLLGVHPPIAGAPQHYIDQYFCAELISSIVISVVVLWLILSRGYQRMQKIMTALMIIMFFCFAIIALRSVGQIGDILTGFIPAIPDNLPVLGQDKIRLSNTTIIAIVGSAIAPGALLGIPYMSSDAYSGESDFKSDLKQAIINLGIIYGVYAMFVLIAGGYALYPLANHAEIETVHQAGQVLGAAFPAQISFIGPVIFTLGLFIAAMTTMIVAVQVICYLSLDMLNKPWAFTSDNVLFNSVFIFLTLISAILAPLWNFPALLKVILIMGLNVLVIPLVLCALLYLLNRADLMKEYVAGKWRNTILVICLVISMGLAVEKAPDYWQLLMN